MIHIRSLCSSVALCILILQLATMPVQVAYPTISYGEFSVEQIHERITHTYTPLTVRLVNAEPVRDSIVFVGDVLLARNIEHLMTREGYDYPYKGVSFTNISVSPYVFGNFESSIPREHIPTPTKMIRFSVHEKFLPEFAKAGFTHVSLANNHALDFGQLDFQNTQTELKEAGVVPVGHPKRFDESSVTFVEVENSDIAVIALHALERIPSVTEISSVLRYASARSDVQILFVHWGNEYESRHSTKQRDLAERFVDAGTDVIVGHHPHVVQDIDVIDGVPVFYSLGNYIFDQYDSAHTQVGLLLQFTFTDGGAVTLFPVTSIGSLSQPYFMKPEKHIRFLQALAANSHPDVQEHVASGFIPLNVSVASLPKMAMMSQ